MKTEIKPFNILVIEDNAADFYLIESMLRASTLNVEAIHQATRISGACGILKTHKIGLILLDLSLPDSFGMDSFTQIKSFVQHIPVIILTGLSESATATEALQQGAQDYLVKGEFKTDLLERTIRYSIERKNAEEKILASEANYRQMFYKNPFPAWIYDMDNWKVLEVNDAAIQKYGYSREEFLELTVEDVRLVEDIPLLRLLNGKHNRDHLPKETLWKHKKKNGDVMLMQVTFYQIHYFGKMAMQAQLNDVTEKKQLENDLQEEQTQRQQQIAEAILGAQEDERKILGAELHDNINQILAAANLFLTVGLHDQAELAAMISKGKNYIILAIEEIRKLSKTLITPVFISTGLKQSIEGLVADIRGAKKMEIITDLDTLDDAVLSEVLKITIYRILQEQLNNILKHAEATRVRIGVQINSDNIFLTINDNGKGADLQLPVSGIGMKNIKHRAELFKGSVIINSSPGNGFSMEVSLYIKAIPPQQEALCA